MKNIKAALLFSALITSSTVSADLTTGLLAYYPFNGNANEETGQYVDGILNGDASFKKGVIGQALYLDGNGDYVDLGNGLNLNQKYSVSFWVKSEDLSRKYAAVLAKYETNGYGPYDFSLHYNKANLWVSNGQGGALSVDSKANISKNIWAFVSYTVNSGQLSIYVNGRLSTTRTIPAMTKNNDRVTIGRQALMFSPYSDLEFKGYIDEVRIYNRSLSAAEINKLYNAGVAVSGTVKSLEAHTVTCKNETTGQIVNIAATQATTYDCEAKGLIINTGETASIFIKGVVQ